MAGQLTLDGKTVSFKEGQTLLEVALENRVKIPSLCYHRKTGPAGRCRLCVVEVEGRRNLAPACCTPVVEGMARAAQDLAGDATRDKVIAGGELESEDTDVAWNSKIGVLFELSAQTRFGLVYASKVDYSFAVDATGTLPRLARSSSTRSPCPARRSPPRSPLSP